MQEASIAKLTAQVLPRRGLRTPPRLGCQVQGPRSVASHAGKAAALPASGQHSATLRPAAPVGEATAAGAPGAVPLCPAGPSGLSHAQMHPRGLSEAAAAGSGAFRSPGHRHGGDWAPAGRPAGRNCGQRGGPEAGQTLCLLCSQGSGSCRGSDPILLSAPHAPGPLRLAARPADVPRRARCMRDAEAGRLCAVEGESVWGARSGRQPLASCKTSAEHDAERSRGPGAPQA